MFGIKSLNQCNLFIAFYCLYLVLSSYKTSALTGYMLLAIIMVSFGYFLYVLFNMKQPKMLKWLSILFIMFGVYGMFHIFFGEEVVLYSGKITSFEYIKKIAASMLPVYPFYVFSRRGLLTPNVIWMWMPIIILITIYSFYQDYNLRLEKALKHGAFKVKEFTNNVGYVFVSLLPILFVKQKRLWYQFVLIGITAFFIVSSAKRGAIVTGGCAIAYFLYNIVSQAKRTDKYRYLFIIFVAFMISGYYISGYIENSIYFHQRLEATASGDSSGRNILYSRLWDAFTNFNFIEFFLGQGADSTVIHTGGVFAHNDWLEILVNQGLLGVVIYIVFFYVVFKTWKKYKHSADFGSCLGGLMIVLFMSTLFSMSYSMYYLGVQMAFGYSMAKVYMLSVSGNVTGIKE